MVEGCGWWEVRLWRLFSHPPPGRACVGGASLGPLGRVADTEARASALEQEAEGLRLRLQDAEGEREALRAQLQREAEEREQQAASRRLPGAVCRWDGA